MILLDTDHLNMLVYRQGTASTRLVENMENSFDQDFATTIVSVEEQMRGWLAEIHRHRELRKQLVPYHRLAELIDFWTQWEVIRIDERVADEFERLRKQRIRVGTQDLKIAAVAIAHDATLLLRIFATLKRSRDCTSKIGFTDRGGPAGGR